MPEESMIQRIDRLEVIEALQAAPDPGGWRAGMDRDDYEPLAVAVESLIAQRLERARVANAELLRERNTWAREIADVRDDLATAREEAAAQRDRANALDNERTALLVELDDVKARAYAWKSAAAWRGAPPDLPGLSTSAARED